MRLICERGAERIAFPLDEGETYIGRKDDCDIYFPDTSLSKRHARLVRRGRALTVHDAGSKNGTLVNGEEIDGPTPLRDGDVVQCGKLAFTVEGVGGDDFDIVSDEETAGGRAGRRAVASRAGSKSAPTARAVHSGEVRGSVLDEFPELPLSGEGAGADVGPTARFRLVEGGDPQVWDLTGETITIGAKAENAIVITGDGISRYHAEVLREGGRWVLKDLGARNGLFVAGDKIDLHELQDGDEVQIGTVKLRFELVKASPLADVRALVDALTKDPVGTFKREPRVRIGAACLVAALVLLFMAMPSGGRKPRSGGGDDTAWILEGTAKLEQGNYRDARDIFRRQQVHVQSHQQHLPRALTALATHYATLDDSGGAANFRWDRAESLLLDCARLEGLPEETQAWISAQMGPARANHEAYLKFDEAKKAAAQALGLAHPSQKKYREALRAFEIAITRYGEVPASSSYGELARAQSTTMRTSLYQMVVTHARELMQAPSPDWQGIVRFLSQAEGYAETSDQRHELRRIKDECETNQRDEEYYQTAVDIVSIRDVENYPRAVRLLDKVDRRSRIYPDAQAYIQWIDADLEVRQAQTYYQSGDEKRAFKLLNEAMQKEVLGPAARESIRTRRSTWGRVVTAYQRGSELLDAGRTREAKEEFERVIELEPNQANRYHNNALGHLKHLQQLAGLSLERKLREGLDALENSQYDAAYRYFGDVTRDPNKQPRDLQKITQAVVNANRSRRLLSNAEREFTRDQSDRFLEIYYITKLLRRWLPDGERSQRADAERLYQQVLKRLKTLQMISGTIEDE